jgi:hypothetical protein
VIIWYSFPALVCCAKKNLANLGCIGLIFIERAQLIAINNHSEMPIENKKEYFWVQNQLELTEIDII